MVLLDHRRTVGLWDQLLLYSEDAVQDCLNRRDGPIWIYSVGLKAINQLVIGSKDERGGITTRPADWGCFETGTSTQEE